MVVITAINLDSIELQVAKVRSDVDRRVRNLMFSIALIATALIGIIGALSLVLVKRSLRPLTLIRAHLDEIAAGEGDLTRRLPLVSRDELDNWPVRSMRLSKRFTALSARLLP